MESSLSELICFHLPPASRNTSEKHFLVVKKWAGLQILQPEGCVSKVVIVKNEWLTSTHRHREGDVLLFCRQEVKKKKENNTRRRLIMPYWSFFFYKSLARGKLPRRREVRNEARFRFSWSDEEDMGPSRTDWVRITASHVSTMGTYPV